MLLVSSLTLGEEFIITQDTASCWDSGGSCSTLSEQISSPHSFSSNSIVRFSAGTHSISENTNSDSFVLRDLYNLTLSGDGESPSEIKCYHPMKFVFINVTKLTISNLSFLNCSSPFSEELLNNTIFLVPQIQQESAYNHFVALFLYHIVDLKMSYVSVCNSTGFGLLGINVLGDSLVTHSNFSFNNFPHFDEQTYCFTSNRNNLILECAGGGFVVEYTDTPTCDLAYEVQTLSITSSYFGYNLNLRHLGFGGGLAVTLAQSYYGVQVHIDSVTSEGNLAAVGANIALLQYNCAENSSFTISNSISRGSNSLLNTSAFFLLDTYSTLGGGLWVLFGLELPLDSIVCPRLPKLEQSKCATLYVSNMRFVNNQATVGGGAYLSIQGRKRVSLISFDNCYFAENSGNLGSALAIEHLPSLEARHLTIYKFKDCIFEKNTFPVGDLDIDVKFDILNTVLINSANNVTFENCQFIENNGTALFVYDTKVSFIGNSTFENNRGSDGGALAIHGSSVMILQPNTNITFIGNTAQKGGAIFVSNKRYISKHLCFWQIDTENESVLQSNISTELNIQLKFLENKARDAGSVLFGGSVDRCLLTLSAINPGYNSTTVFEDLFQIRR